MRKKKERNALFNNALKPFYLVIWVWTYGKGSLSTRRNPLQPPYGLYVPISSKSFFICTIPHRIAYITAFVTPVMEHCLEQEIVRKSPMAH